MKSKSFIFSALLTVGISLFSCNGGGGGGSSSSSSPTSSGNTYLPYQASIDFVDPSTLSVKNVESKKILGAVTFEKAIKFDKTSYEVENDFLTYITDEGNGSGKIYKVSLRKDGSQTPVQISNISDAVSIEDWFEDNGNGIGYLVIQRANMTKVLVNTNMSSSDNPIDMSQFVKIIGTFVDVNNKFKITGFLVLNTNNKVQKCDTNLQNCVDIVQANNSSSVYDTSHYDVNRDEYYLCINNNWFRIFSDGNSRNTNVVCSTQGKWTADRDYIYFYVDDGNGNKILKKMSKSNDTVVSLYSTKNTVDLQGNIRDYVITIEYDNQLSTYNLKAINKSNGSVVSIKSSSQDIASINYKNLVYYSYHDGNTLHACFWDGTNNQDNCNPDSSYWGGAFVKKSGNINYDYSGGEIDMEIELYKIVLAENDKIYSVNPDNPNDRTLIGNIPNGYSLFAVDGLGSSGLGMALDTNYRYDIFFMDVDSKLLRQITNTPDKSEEAIW